ncbi:unnamed protein product [Ceutorhynchus assimilis]|uniref:Mab-21-like HhH/H2TH-like domain-containing protein n=1 Tax=Ceutorhynchus assimilis TaxID=467358 RepID=A0A9N9QEB0_9CUCU|nr:unnamed protein product [Ceutorhynchus assimilis]
MGCQHSKLKHRVSIVDTANQDNEEKVNDAVIIGRHDEEMINTIRRDLNETPEMFVLNNVIMCTMFLKNYQEDIYQVLKQMDNAPNKFWEPDIVMEKANRNVIYRPMHGSNKDIASPLTTRRIYVPMNDYIEVFNPLDDEDAAADDDDEKEHISKYHVKVEESKRPGYVKLRRINAERNNDKNSLKDMLVVPSSNASSSSDTESTITSSGSPIQDNFQLIKDQTDEGVSLDDCFVFRKVKKPDIDIELEELDHEHLTEDDIYDIVSYLPSKKFMKYFSKIFKESMAKKIGLIQYEIDHAAVDDRIPGKIFCNLRDENGNSYPVEVVPCLKTAWPKKQTYNLLEGKPNHNMESDWTGFDFQWPTHEMLDEMKTFECALVPKGYARNNGTVPEDDLEWEIHFPLAENYLEMLLRPEQIKCFLLLLSIYKEYLEPKTKVHGIVPEHLLNMMFWEAEKNYDDWPTHRLGFRLINVIENFSNRLTERVLRDFFIRKRNVLKNVPTKCIVYAGEEFFRIKESPLIKILRAMRNVRYTSGTFYPPLDYKELLNILYKTDWDVNPYLSNTNLKSDGISISTSGKKPKFMDAEKQLQHVKLMQMRKKAQKKKNIEIDRKKSEVISYNSTKERRDSVDSLDDQWECEKRFDLPKKIALLKFFINNFIEIAQTSMRISTKKQTLFYLKQAWYLTKILEEENKLFAADVAGYFDVIKKQEDKVITAMQVNLSTYGKLEVFNIDTNNNKNEELDDDLDDLDELPKTTLSKQAIIDHLMHEADIHQQIRHMKINLKSLSKSFSSSYNKQVTFETSR